MKQKLQLAFKTEQDKKAEAERKFNFCLLFFKSLCLSKALEVPEGAKQRSLRSDGVLEVRRASKQAATKHNGAYNAFYCIFSLSILVTIPGLALPRDFFIIWPTRKPIALSLPAL